MKIDLGEKRPDYGPPEMAKVPEKPKKFKVVYPTVTVEKWVPGATAFGDEITATVRFKVREIADGARYEGDKPVTRITLELLDMEVEGEKSTAAERESPHQRMIEEGLKQAGTSKS